MLNLSSNSNNSTIGPTTMDPINGRNYVKPSDIAGVAASSGMWARVDRGGYITHLNLYVGTSNGNISMAVYNSTGTGLNVTPGARKATTGSIACPSVGMQAVVLTTPVQVDPGDWLCLTSDSITAAFFGIDATNGGAGGSVVNVMAGRTRASTVAAHPAATTAPATAVTPNCLYIAGSYNP